MEEKRLIYVFDWSHLFRVIYLGPKRIVLDLDGKFMMVMTDVERALSSVCIGFFYAHMEQKDNGCESL